MSEKRVATIYDYVRFTDTVCGEPCEDCPVSCLKNGFDCACNVLRQEHTDEYNDILLKWIDEHPVKTFNDDFMEKFPKAMTMDNMGKTSVCKKTLYGGDCILDCKKCWNQPYEESEDEE